MTRIQIRRLIIVLFLLSLGVAGAVLRHYAAIGSTLRDVGTLMMVLWVPAVGNIIAWLIARLKRRPKAAVPGFEAGAAFEPHVYVELTLRPAAVPAEDGPIPVGEHRCALVIGNQAFSARWFVRPGETVRRGVAHRLDVQFLAPAAALPVFPPHTAFRMLVGPAFIGDGLVLEVSGHA